MFDRCNSLIMELDEQHKLEESYGHTRARANEIRDGDKNTKYFHHKASQRCRSNIIWGLMDSDNRCKTEEDNILNIIGVYFDKLFKCGNPAGFEEAMKGLRPCVMEDMNRVLNLEPTGDEIRSALFQMHPNKAPGPDGMQALFFNKIWHVIGPDIISFVRCWWRGNGDLSTINNT